MLKNSECRDSLSGEAGPEFVAIGKDVFAIRIGDMKIEAFIAYEAGEEAVATSESQISAFFRPRKEIIPEPVPRSLILRGMKLTSVAVTALLQASLSPGGVGTGLMPRSGQRKKESSYPRGPAH